MVSTFHHAADYDIPAPRPHLRSSEVEITTEDIDAAGIAGLITYMANTGPDAADAEELLGTEGFRLLLLTY